MIIAITVILMLVFYLALIKFYYNKYRLVDLFHPSLFALYIAFLTNIPFLIFALIIPKETINSLVFKNLGTWALEEVVIYYICLQIFCMIFLQIGISNKFVTSKILAILPILKTNVTKRNTNLGLIIIILFLVIITSIILNNVGGLNNILSNLEKRAILFAGLTYFIKFYQVLIFLFILVFLYTFKFSSSLLKKILFLALLLFSFSMLSFRGDRLASIMLIGFVIFTIHYAIKKIKFSLPKFSILIFFILIYMITIKMIRKPDALNVYSSNPSYLVQDIADELVLGISETSYVSNYLLVLLNFDSGNIWLGKSFNDIYYAYFSSQYEDKRPPIDEGVYLRNIAEGIRVEPPTPLNQMIPSSIPPETFGFMFMNFWIPGLFFGMIILGILYKTAYIYMINSEKNLYSITIYSYMIFWFQLTNLRIIQFILFLIPLTLLFLLLFKSKRKKIRISNVIPR